MSEEKKDGGGAEDVHRRTTCTEMKAYICICVPVKGGKGQNMPRTDAMASPHSCAPMKHTKEKKEEGHGNTVPRVEPSNEDTKAGKAKTDIIITATPARVHICDHVTSKHHRCFTDTRVRRGTRRAHCTNENERHRHVKGSVGDVMRRFGTEHE